MAESVTMIFVCLVVWGSNGSIFGLASTIPKMSLPQNQDQGLRIVSPRLRLSMTSCPHCTIVGIKDILIR